MIPSQYSLISLSQSWIPLIEFNPSPPRIPYPFQRIPLSKVFSATGARVQVSAAATPIAIDTIMIDIPKFQLAMLAKKVATLVEQGGNSNSMNALTLSNVYVS